MHTPDSPNLQNDDRRIETMDSLWGKEVVITEKLDGENTSLHSHKLHARSENGDAYPWQSVVKGKWGSVKHLIPANIQICGENVYAKHSIAYDQLDDCFYVFNVIDKDRNVFLSVDETLEWCERLGFKYVPILYRGVLSRDYKVPWQSAYGGEMEGYVIRSVAEFPVDEYKNLCAKFVRKNHVRTTEHWSKTWVPNKIRGLDGSNLRSDMENIV
jgi:hypothetical protein